MQSASYLLALEQPAQNAERTRAKKAIAPAAALLGAYLPRGELATRPSKSGSRTRILDSHQHECEINALLKNAFGPRRLPSWLPLRLKPIAGEFSACRAPSAGPVPRMVRKQAGMYDEAGATVQQGVTLAENQFGREHTGSRSCGCVAEVSWLPTIQERIPILSPNGVAKDSSGFRPRCCTEQDNVHWAQGC